MGINSGGKSSRSEQLLLGPRRKVTSAESAAPSGNEGWDVSQFDQIVIAMKADAEGSAKAQVWRRYRTDEDTAGQLEDVWVVGEYLDNVALDDVDGSVGNRATFLVNTLGCDRLQVKVVSITTSTEVYVAAFGLAKAGSGALLSSAVATTGDQTDINLVEIAGNSVASGGINGTLVVAGDKADGSEATVLSPLKCGAVADNVDLQAQVDAGSAVHLLTDLYRRLRVVVESTVTTQVTGDTADDDAAGTVYPVLVGGVADAAVSVVTDGDAVKLVTDLYRRLRVVVDNLATVAGDVADDAAATSTAPLKIGAVADDVVSTVADADMVHLVTDLYRRLRTISAAFDTLTESDKVSVQNTIASDRDYTAQELADVTDQDTGTSNYPSDDGIEVGNRPQLFFALTLLDVTSVAFQCSNDRSIWIDQTEDVVESGAALHAKTYFTAAGEATYYAPRWTCGWRYVRCAVAVPNGTNTVAIDMIARALA